MFTNDDHRAMCLVLCIMHQNLHSLPGLLTLEELKDLAEITAKYDLIHLIARFLDQWLSIYRGALEEPKREDWLAVAYHFGNDMMYPEIAKYIAFQSQVDEGGALLIPQTGLPLQPISVPHAYSCISAARKQALSQYLDVVRDVVAKPCCVPHVDNPAQNNHVLEHYLQQHSLYPQEDPRRTRLSILQVMHLLTDDETAHHTSSLDLNNHVAGCNVRTRLSDQVLQVDMELSWAANVTILTQIGKNAAIRGRCLHPKSRGVRLMPREWRNEREIFSGQS
ncbi:hypothetical protein HBI56_075010 [Parastagonospora nodorum]|uniref:Uncharacterized protein n=1 Tax=Phaeosphaeria nodorum (strain SN15 / ATCC MYA-4574 / FGSC 10173) TaxID=321614 RepID=A0A7U2HWE4_PHANO|nr:hypothetical protein HBH56_169980 [Parastagonospora nodorum]QRC94410.1 hypothetical protein JI435_076560 [Parastagonospora nodorum SN15]KAH3928406.1 hypothetical protein HBH54_138530 [Parastagonospora nodorum]KAH3945282.1 hypothetical protein HBH53_143880 [Parastagonospora nodorum]KAH3983973.1 hypothetical protein HBH52_060340 [Parastagonospora nodorum]